MLFAGAFVLLIRAEIACSRRAVFAAGPLRYRLLGVVSAPAGSTGGRDRLSRPAPSAGLRRAARAYRWVGVVVRGA